MIGSAAIIAPRDSDVPLAYLYDIYVFGAIKKIDKLYGRRCCRASRRFSTRARCYYASRYNGER